MKKLERKRGDEKIRGDVPKTIHQETFKTLDNGLPEGTYRYDSNFKVSQKTNKLVYQEERTFIYYSSTGKKVFKRNFKQGRSIGNNFQIRDPRWEKMRYRYLVTGKTCVCRTQVTTS